jgi:hypothetical protein
MVVFASTQQSPSNDGVQYALNMPVPAAEGDLANGNANAPEGDPIAVLYDCAMTAVVVLTAQGNLGAGQSTYVIMQTDMGDGVWIDVAGFPATVTTGTSQTWVLSGGAAGAIAIQQSRTVGTAPSAAFANQFPLGGRVRFVGKTVPAGGSSSSSSSGAIAAQVLCSIRVKGLGLR